MARRTNMNLSRADIKVKDNGKKLINNSNIGQRDRQIDGPDRFQK